MNEAKRQLERKKMAAVRARKKAQSAAGKKARARKARAIAVLEEQKRAQVTGIKGYVRGLYEKSERNL